MTQTRATRIDSLQEIFPFFLLIILGVQTSAMDYEGGVKVTGIKQIVRLKGFLQKWQSVTLGPKGNNSPRSNQVRGGISPQISRRLRSSSNFYCDSDEETCQSPEPPHGVPRGYLAVYVGPELRRFIIPTSYLTHPLFKLLLEKVEEEFGFDHCGGLTIPCEIETFKYLIQYIENHHEEQAENNSAEDSYEIEE